LHYIKVLFRLDNVLRKFFVGQFRKAEEAPHEKRMIAHFDAKIPIEAISELGWLKINFCEIFGVVLSAAAAHPRI
jgi:hypothetical protein